MHVGVHDGPSVARSGPPPMLICCRSVLYAGLFAATSDLRRLIYNGVCTLHHRSTHCTRGIEGQHPTVTGAAGTTVGDEHRATTRHRDWARHTQHCLNRRAGDCRGGRGRDANLRDTPKQKRDVHLEGGARKNAVKHKVRVHLGLMVGGLRRRSIAEIKRIHEDLHEGDLDVSMDRSEGMQGARPPYPPQALGCRRL